MTEKELSSITSSISMPEGMAGQLKNSLAVKRPGKPRLRCSRLIAAALVCFITLSTGITAYASYHIYQLKNLRIFFEADVSRDQLAEAGNLIAEIDGVSSVEFVDANAAWQEFQTAYLDEAAASEFTVNPLQNSFNYKVSVRLDADTGKVRAAIARISGVRLVSDISEL